MNRTIFLLLIALAMPLAGRCDPPQVSVRGNVLAPQRIPWHSKLTVLSAIGNAGGTMGALEIIVHRGGERLRFRSKDLIRGKTPDPKLLPGNIVEVLDAF